MSEDLTKKLPTGDDAVVIILRNIDSRLQALEQKVEERLHDTRPIWQKVVADIAQLQAGQQHLQEGQSRLEGDIREMRVEVHEIKVSINDICDKIEVLNDAMLHVQAKNKNFAHRIRKLEAPHEKPTNSET